jgi:hypothetical protein
VTEQVVGHGPTIDGLNADPAAVPSAGAGSDDVDNLPDGNAAAAAGRSEIPHDGRAVPLAPNIKIAVSRPMLTKTRVPICFLLCGGLAANERSHSS